MKAIWGIVVENGVSKRRIILLETRKCEECKNEFEPKKQDSKYCSTRCSKKAYNDRTKDKNSERSRRWYKNNIEKAKEKRKAYYWSDPEKFRQKTREYFASRREQKREQDSEYKDKTRHDGKRKELLEENGCVCSICGKEKKSFQIIAHHKTFNSSEHEHQELLCKSCHAKTHGLGKSIGFKRQ